MATAKDTRARRAHARTPKARPRPAPLPPENRLDREQRADVALKLARAAQPARPSPDSVRAGTLRRIRDELDFICSCAIVVRRALIEQNCELDEDAARVLKRCVSDELAGQIERIDVLLGDSPNDKLSTGDDQTRSQS